MNFRLDDVLLMYAATTFYKGLDRVSFAHLFVGVAYVMGAAAARRWREGP